MNRPPCPLVGGLLTLSFRCEWAQVRDAPLCEPSDHGTLFDEHRGLRVRKRSGGAPGPGWVVVRSFYVTLLKVEPDLDNLCSDQRFQELLRRKNYPP